MKKAGIFFAAVFFILFRISGVSHADTIVSSDITYDTTWTKANSPYIVTQTIDINQTSPGQTPVTLTVEPGVVVKFVKGAALNVSGTLMAKGTADEMIVFTSTEAAPIKGDWGGISFQPTAVGTTGDQNGNYVSGSIIQYCEISYGRGILNLNPVGLWILNNRILNNSSGLAVVWSAPPGGGINNAGDSLIIGNTISNNSSSAYGLSYSASGGGIYNTGNSIISGNTISGNSSSASNKYLLSSYSGGGICNAGISTISGNTVTGNTSSAFASGGGILSGSSTIIGNTINGNTSSAVHASGGGIYNSGNSTISENEIGYNMSSPSNYYAFTSGGGIYSKGDSTITGNVIKANSGIDGSAIYNNGAATIENNSIICNSALYGIDTGPLQGFSGNNLYNSATIYDFYYSGASDQPASNNYWGTTNDAEISDRIYDFWDAANLGKVLFQPFATTPFIIQGEGVCCIIFTDVPYDYWAGDFIEKIACNGITVGCGNDNFCPEDSVSRAQMAVFLLRVLGEPPAATCTGMFGDVSIATVGEAFCKYIEQFATLGITSGCSAGNYCPDDPVTRAQMAVFITKALGETTATTCEGTFNDVNEWTGGNPAFCKFIEKFSTLGITAGCGNGNYCPDDLVSRAQMAVFLTNGFLQ
jgi:putative cofactor-binding repeat protein